MPGDNFRVTVHSRGREHFNAAVLLAFGNSIGSKATHYVRDLPERSCLGGCFEGRCTTWEPYAPGENKRESVEHACPTCHGTGKIPPESAMILLWYEADVRNIKATPLPFPLTSATVTDFLWSWLQTVEYPPQPDHDGSNSKGFIVTTGDCWGHIEGCHYTVLAVYPDWQMHGK